LDASISNGDSTEFGEIVGDEDAQTPFELLRDKNLRDELSDLLEILDDRERKIIFQRFGLDGGKPKTLEEVGKKLGSRESESVSSRISPWRNCVRR
jgi:RNA polymerase primary sigma factor